MGRQQFVLILERMPSAAQAKTLARLPGLCVSRRHRGGVARVHVDQLAATVFEALHYATHHIESVGLRVLRLDDQDWVTLAQIGGRIGRSRECIRLWATGRTGPGDFPPPISPTHNSTTVYSWSEVAPWLCQHTDLEIPSARPDLRAANLALQLRALAITTGGIEHINRLLTGEPYTG